MPVKRPSLEENLKNLLQQAGKENMPVHEQLQAVALYIAEIFVSQKPGDNRLDNLMQVGTDSEVRSFVRAIQELIKLDPSKSDNKEYAETITILNKHKGFVERRLQAMLNPADRAKMAQRIENSEKSNVRAYLLNAFSRYAKEQVTVMPSREASSLSASTKPESPKHGKRKG